MGKTSLGREDDASNKEILVVVLPFVFGIITAVLYVSGLWWLAITSALIGTGAMIWAFRARENEKADAAIARAAEGTEQSSAEATDGEQRA